MSILNKLLLYAFRKQNILLIKSFLFRKSNILIDDLSLITFLEFYYSDFCALVDYNMNKKLNYYKLLLYKLMVGPDYKILNIMFTYVLLYLLFVAKLLILERQVNQLYHKSNYKKNYENYLSDLSVKINGVTITKIKFSKFIQCNYQVFFTMILK
jgi:hypothetical protein